MKRKEPGPGFFGLTVGTFLCIWLEQYRLSGVMFPLRVLQGTAR
jgi:hypothetical protein